MIRDMSDKATVELAAEMIRLGIPQRDAISLAMACDAEEEAIELVGKKGYIHGWIFVGAPGAEKPVAPDDVQPHDLIRLAQKHARHLPSGVSLGGATKGQIVRAIQKGQQEEGKRPASPAGPASGVKPPAARTAADVHRANGFSRAFADAIAPPPDGSHGFGAADPRRTAALHIAHSVAMSQPGASHAQLTAETSRLLGVPVPKNVRTPPATPPTKYEKPPTAAQASRAQRIAKAVSGLDSAGPGSPRVPAAAYHAATSYALLQPRESDAAIGQAVGQILSGAGIGGKAAGPSLA